MGCSQDKSQPVTNISFQCINEQSTCEVITKFGTVLVKFNAEKILTEVPFNVRVEFKKDHFLSDNTPPQALTNVVGYIEGKTMFMGKIPLFFNHQPVDKKQNQFIAETMLGSCSQDRMTWRIWITLEINDVNKKKDHTTFFIDFVSTRFS
ncbi:MAG: hypothetical protein QMC13_07525 [Colwellia sp.]